MDTFQGQNRINKELVNLIYTCDVNLSVVHCRSTTLAEVAIIDQESISFFKVEMFSDFKNIQRLSLNP